MYQISLAVGSAFSDAELTALEFNICVPNPISGEGAQARSFHCGKYTCVLVAQWECGCRVTETVSSACYILFIATIMSVSWVFLTPPPLPQFKHRHKTYLVLSVAVGTRHRRKFGRWGSRRSEYPLTSREMGTSLTSASLFCFSATPASSASHLFSSQIDFLTGDAVNWSSLTLRELCSVTPETHGLKCPNESQREEERFMISHSSEQRRREK